MNLNVGPDAYTRAARPEAGAAVVLPAALAVLAWLPDAKLGAPWAVVVTCGGTYLMAQVARMRGKAKEPELFARFGGPPTIARLKQLDAPNPVTLHRWRRKLQELLPDQTLPTPEQERDDPEGANRIYASITQLLIEKTRDKTKFDLVVPGELPVRIRSESLGAQATRDRREHRVVRCRLGARLRSVGRRRYSTTHAGHWRGYPHPSARLAVLGDAEAGSGPVGSLR